MDYCCPAMVSNISSIFAWNLHGICMVLQPNAPKCNKNTQKIGYVKMLYNMFLIRNTKEKHQKSIDFQCFINQSG